MKTRLIGILGLGIFGSTVAKSLVDYDVDVIAIDKDEANVDRLANIATRAVVGDITDEELLEALGIGDCDAVVIATGSHLESSSLAVLACRNLGVTRIICKAKNTDYSDILKAVGATSTVQPEKESGRRLAHSLMRSDIEDVLTLDSAVSLVEFHPPKKWIGKDLQSLDLRNKFQINLLGFRESPEGSLNIDIDADTIVQPHHILVGLTNNENLERQDFLD